MASIALGWLHWSEDQLYRADMNAIMVGYRGMSELLSALFGPPKPVVPVKKPKVQAGPPKLTAAAFDLMFSGKNGARKGKH